MPLGILNIVESKIPMLRFSKGRVTRAPYEPGCATPSVFPWDQVLSQIDWLPISRRQISLQEVVLRPRVWLPREAFLSHSHAL
jgi:hypothetical protein